jgi:hypothetical protein
MVSAELDLAYHLEYIVRTEHKMASPEMNLAFSKPRCPVTETAQYNHHANCCACACEIHLSTHVDSCVKYPCQYCRYCKPSVFAAVTGASLVEIQEDPMCATDPWCAQRRKKKSMLPSNPRFVYHNPVPELPFVPVEPRGQIVPPIDSRPIKFEIRRRGPADLRHCPKQLDVPEDQQVGGLQNDSGDFDNLKIPTFGSIWTIMKLFWTQLCKNYPFTTH